MSYTTRSSNRTADGRAVVNVRGDHGMTNDQNMNDGRQIIGKQGGTRMAGDKMTSFQQSR